MTEVEFAAGDEIFAEGDPAEDAFVIDSGEVDIVKEVDGEPVVLARLGAGEIFGEMGLVDDKPRSATARAATDVQLRCMSHEHFMYVLTHRPEESLAYLKVLFERLRSANTKVSLDPFTAVPTSAATTTRIVTAPEPLSGPVPIRIIPASDEARHYIPKEGLTLARLPFRFGRVHTDPFATNDLVVVDQQPYSVSRYHFLIDRAGDGFVIRDRGSYLGTIVNGETIGGKRHNEEVMLRPGTNTLVVGSSRSPFRFELEVSVD